MSILKTTLGLLTLATLSTGALVESIEQLGPFNASQRSISLGIDSENSNRWFLGTDGGGLWVSSNAGSSWSPYDKLNRYGTHISDIQQDETTPSNWYYLAGGGYGDDFPNPGVYQSTDNGVTFTKRAGKIIPNGTFQAYNLFVHDGDVWVRDRDHGIYKSNSNGTYTKLYDASQLINTATMTVENGTVIFILSTSDKIIRVTETGTVDTVFTKSGANFCSVGASKSSPNIVYASFTNSSNIVTSVYKNSNYGKSGSWTLVKVAASGVPFASGGYGTGTDLYQMDGFGNFCGLVVDPTNPNRLFITSTNVIGSEDGGNTWFAKRASGGIGYGDMWPNSYTALPNSTKYIFGHDHGLFVGEISELLDMNDDGYPDYLDLDIVEDRSKGVGAFTSYVGDFFPTGKKVITGAQDRGGWIIDGTTEVSASGGDVYMTLVTSDRVHVFNKHGSARIYNSDHDGVKISQQSSGEPVVTYNTMHQAGVTDADEIVYGNDYGTSTQTVDGHKYIFSMSTDGGDTFIPYFLGDSPIRSVATHRTARKSYFYEGSNLRYFDHQTKAITIAGNAGFGWDEIEINDGDASVVYFYNSDELVEFDLVTKNKTTLTSFFGTTQIDGNDLELLTIAGIHRDTIFAGTNYGIYSSVDRGASWQKEQGFPDVIVNDVDIRLTDTTLFAHTYGLGSWYGSIGEQIASNYTINATAYGTVTISPEGETTVAVGGSQTYEISVPTGSQIDSIKVNNSKIGITSSYEFTDVDSPQTIDVWGSNPTVPNTVPVINSTIKQIVDMNNTLTLALSMVNFTDPDDDIHSLIVIEGDNYTVDGTEITPANDFYGTLTVEIQIDDETATSASDYITVEVQYSTAILMNPSASNVKALSIVPNPLPSSKSTMTIALPDFAGEYELSIFDAVASRVFMQKGNCSEKTIRWVPSKLLGSGSYLAILRVTNSSGERELYRSAVGIQK